MKRTLLFLLIFFGSLVMAQPPGGGGDPGGGGPVPLGGIEILLAAGAALGLKKLMGNKGLKRVE